MLITPRKSIIACLCLVFYVSGCTTSPRAATPTSVGAHQAHVPIAPSENIRQNLGNIGVAANPAMPDVRFLAPTPIKGAGAAAGRMTGRALAGFWKGCGVTMGVTAETLIIPALTLYGCAVLTPFVAVGGALHGHSDSDASKANRAAKAKHEAEIEELRPAVDSALDIVAAHPPLQLLVLERAQARTHRTFVMLTAPDTSGSRERHSYRDLKGDGLDTILEITMWRLAFTPDHAFALTARTQLIQTVDDQELYAGTYTVKTEAHTISEWTADGGELVATALINAYRELAELIVDNLFLFRPQPHSTRPPDRLYLM